MLSGLRFAVERSRGRRYPELPHPYRNEFQRDRDRVIHTRAFRRLENKTQVFTPGLSDHFRNRLTHTIEVAQIARTVSGALGLNEDLTEALALVHDIGHPPFAHAGEEQLDRLMRRFGEGFNHNLHALRIVDTFEQRYALFPGLNLTFEVREGIVKHSRDLGEDAPADQREFLPGQKPPLEAQIIDLADEIAYNTADLDDAFSAGLFERNDLCAEMPAVGERWELVEGHYPAAAPRIHFQEVLRGLIDAMVSGLIEGTVSAAHLAGVTDAEAVRHQPVRLAAFTPETGELARGLKQFLRRSVYDSGELAEGRARSAAMIAELFDLFLRRPDLLPEGHRELLDREPNYRVVCDYIAGMTDGFFERTWEECSRRAVYS